MLLKTGEEYLVSDDLHQDLIDAYGEDMVRNELTAMKMWLLTNPLNAKPKSVCPSLLIAGYPEPRRLAVCPPLFPSSKQQATKTRAVHKLRWAIQSGAEP